MTMAQCSCTCHYEGWIMCTTCCPEPTFTCGMERCVMFGKTVDGEHKHMDGKPGDPEPPVGTNAPVNGDFGKAAGDHDQTYQFGCTPTVAWPYPFLQGQFAHLLVLRGKYRAGEVTEDLM